MMFVHTQQPRSFLFLPLFFFFFLFFFGFFFSHFSSFSAHSNRAMDDDEALARQLAEVHNPLHPAPFYPSSSPSLSLSPAVYWLTKAERDQLRRPLAYLFRSLTTSASPFRLPLLQEDQLGRGSADDEDSDLQVGLFSFPCLCRNTGGAVRRFLCFLLELICIASLSSALQNTAPCLLDHNHRRSTAAPAATLKCFIPSPS